MIRLPMFAALLVWGLAADVAIASTDTVAHWTFDDPADMGRDESGSGLMGTTSGCDAVPGINGHALLADGDDWIDVQASTGVMETLGELNKGTLSLWFTFDREPDIIEVFPLFYLGTGQGGEASGYAEAEIGHFNSCRFLYFTILREINDGQPAIPLCFRTADGLEPGVWYHFVATVGIDENAGYINGEPMVRTFPFGHEGIQAFFKSVVNRATCWIGKGFLGSIPGAQYHEGMMDEVQVWDRPITADEVATLYEAGRYAGDLDVLDQGDVACIGSAELTGTANGLRRLGWRVGDEQVTEVAASLAWTMDVPLAAAGPADITVMIETHFGEVIERAVTRTNVDLSGDGLLDVADLLDLLGGWGGAAADLTGDQLVDVADLLLMLDTWPG